jgi:hypothetical protein
LTVDIIDRDGDGVVNGVPKGEIFGDEMGWLWWRWDVLMEKRECAGLGCLGWYLCMWRCQNKVQGPRNWGNIVELSLDGFYALGTLRFGGLLAFQQEFL